MMGQAGNIGTQISKSSQFLKIKITIYSVISMYDIGFLISH